MFLAQKIMLQEPPEEMEAQLEEHLLSAVEFLQEAAALQEEHPECVTKERVKLLLEKSRWRAVAGDWDLAWSLAQRALVKNEQEAGLDGFWLHVEEVWECVSHLVLLRRQLRRPGDRLQERIDQLHRHCAERLQMLHQELPEEKYSSLRLRSTPVMAWMRSLCDRETKDDRILDAISKKLDEVLLRIRA